MGSMEDIDKLLTLDELADALGGMSRATLYRHFKAIPGFPQPIKVGAATRVRRSEVVAYIKADRTSQNGEGV